MTNYEYIIASLPDITPDERRQSAIDARTILQDILEQCNRSDKALVEFLLKGLTMDPAMDKEDFYSEAVSHPDAFIRRWFSFDLMVRNAKVRYLNAALGRPEGKDIVQAEGAEEDPGELKAIKDILSGDDMLGRERALDDAYWKMAEESVMTDIFTIDIILSFIARLHIVDRWLSLDEAAGREMFRTLVQEVRGSYAGVQYNG